MATSMQPKSAKDREQTVIKGIFGRSEFLQQAQYELFKETLKEAFGLDSKIVDAMTDFVKQNADTNGDGKVSRREFATFLRRDALFTKAVMEQVANVIRTPHGAVKFEETKAGVVEYDKYGNIIYDEDAFTNLGGYEGPGYGTLYGGPCGPPVCPKIGPPSSAPAEPDAEEEDDEGEPPARQTRRSKRKRDEVQEWQPSDEEDEEDEEEEATQEPVRKSTRNAASPTTRRSSRSSRGRAAKRFDDE